MSYKRSRANYESDVPAHQQPPFALFGTPLPPLDSEARDDGSYVPLWKQEVRDERGRKRLHGAFTGGFSAGYFNSVGSKEGWTPSTFVSSRANRRKDENVSTSATQRPEDFMDDEDLADAEEAQKLETQASFAGLGSTQDDGQRRGFLTDLFRSSEHTMGVKLLQRMGWRQGQGVGPRVRRIARMGDGGKGATDHETHLFAPDDSRMIAFDRKKNRFGLGYAAEERLGDARHDVPRDEGEDEDNLGHVSRLKDPTRTKNKPKRSGLGVGILNDTGSDDDDPYEMGPKISYSRIIGGDKKKRKGGLIANTAKPGLTSASSPIFLSRKLTQRTIKSDLRRCHDGRLPLDGFVLATAPLLADQENKHPPPPIPSGWQPKQLTPAKGATATPSEPISSTADAARASTLDPSRRAALLGESQLPGKSIFDYISSSTRDRLASATGAPLPRGLGEAPPAAYLATPADKAKTLWSLVPRLEQSAAAAALHRGTSGWMPYAEDEGKRSRYRAYLELMSGVRDGLPERANGATNDEWVHEMREFAQAALVFKPMSGLMASRFTTSSASAPALASDAPERGDGAAGGAGSGSGKKEDPAEAAARIGMFGPMTRSTLQFFPTRLTCKRFNVKAPAHVLTDPGTGGSGGGSATKDGLGGSAAATGRSDLVSQAKIDQMMREASWSNRATASGKTNDAAAADLDAEPEADTRTPAKTEVVDMERNEAIEGTRAGEAVFKAIFGSDDEDE